MAVGRFFFSADQTAPNSPELNLRFENSFNQPSLVGSLLPMLSLSRMNELKETTQPLTLTKNLRFCHPPTQSAIKMYMNFFYF